VALCCATFPLIWVGGLVTTYGAGMAVPDWPGTYGYNLFLYPWSTWIYGPWDLFIEHGHRLLGSLVGLLTIGLLVTSYVGPRRPALRRAAWIALGLVLLQGGLGGVRVLLDARTLAMIHGCVGPCFFAYSAAMALISSRWWNTHQRIEHRLSPSIQRLAVTVGLLAVCQLVLGAQLRHVPTGMAPSQFSMIVVFHVVVAVALVMHVVALCMQVLRLGADGRSIRTSVLLIAVLLLVQMGLGPATWVVKYGWPEWFRGYRFAADYTIQAESMMQAVVVTAHVATGSLILAAAVVVALRCLHGFHGRRAASEKVVGLMGYPT